MAGDDRRIADRQAGIVPIEIQTVGGQWQPSLAVDLSRTGLGLWGQELDLEDEVVTIRVFKGPDQGYVELGGRLVWNQPGLSGRVRGGVHFDSGSLEI